MTLSKEKFEAIKKKYPLLLVLEDDAADAFAFVRDVLEAEADAIKSDAPYATAAIDRTESAAYIVFEIASDVENEEFSEV